MQPIHIAGAVPHPSSPRVRRAAPSLNAGQVDGVDGMCPSPRGLLASQIAPRIEFLPPVHENLRGHLNIDRLLVSYDLETTGLDTRRDRIVEMAVVVTHPDLTRWAWTSRINPGIDFSGARAIDIHHITPEDVARAPSLAEAMPPLQTFLRAQLAGREFVLNGFNVENYDNLLLREEARRHGLSLPWGEHPVACLDSQKAYVLAHPYTSPHDRRNLASAVGVVCQRGQQHAHGALSDAIDAADVLFGLTRARSTPIKLSDWQRRLAPVPSPARLHHRAA